MLATAVAGALGMIAVNAHAQSSVTLYGIIDAGISYVNNAATSTGHSSYTKFDDGVAQGSRWGVKGAEDLGGGLKAIFTLENGFNVGTGAFGQGGAEFGRQAYVGLAMNDVGSVTLGRQYSFSTDYLGGNYSIGGQTVGGNYAYHINDIDQLTSSRLNNSVKFSSASFSGLTFGGMYAFSNAAGAFGGAAGSSSRAYSFGANYKMGPLGIGAAYTDIRFPGAASPAFSVNIANVNTGGTKDLRTFGVGANYTFGPATVYGLWTNTLFESITNVSSKANIYELGGKYAVTSALTAALGYTFTDLNGSVGGRWQEASASADYALSKRTDVYLLGVYQHAAGVNKGVDVQAQIGSSTSYFGTSGSGADEQVAVRVGLRHKF